MSPQTGKVGRYLRSYAESLAHLRLEFVEFVLGFRINLAKKPDIAEVDFEPVTSESLGRSAVGHAVRTGSALRGNRSKLEP